MNTSLTAPNDQTETWKADKKPSLTDEETKLAMKNLSIDGTINYPKLENII